MTSLNALRLAAAGLTALAVGVVGLFAAPPTGPDQPGPTAARVDGPEPLRASDIIALSARLQATGLFPAAIALPDADTPGDPDGTPEAVESQPPISALVREGGVWRLHAGGTLTERTRLTVGDELFDGWRVQEISATRVLLQRDDESRSIDVFEEP